MTRLILLILLALPLIHAADGELPHFATTEGAMIFGLANQAYSAYAAKDVAKALGLHQKIIATALPPRAVGEVGPVICDSYYNAACEQALLGKTEAAMLGLEQAIAYGYDNMERLKNDSDLDALRTLPRFGELTAAAKKRASSHAETGTLLILEHMTRMALLVPATTSCRERVLALVCTDQQRKRLEALMAKDQTVEIIGRGGTRVTDFALTVSSFKAAPNPGKAP